MRKTFIFVISFLIFTSTFSLVVPSQAKVSLKNTYQIRTTQQSANPQISIEPSIFKHTFNKLESTSAQFTLTLPKVVSSYTTTQNFLQTNFTQTLASPSEIFQKAVIITLEPNQQKLTVQAQINPTKLSKGTHYFLLELLFKEKTEQAGIGSAFGVRLPFLLDIPGEQTNPQFNLTSSSPYIFTENQLKVTLERYNPSENLMNIGAEILVTDAHKNILQTIPLSPSQPSQLASKKGDKAEYKLLEALPKKGFLPYFGKVNLLVRASVNNERHLQTKEVSIWIVPIQLILLAVSPLILVIVWMIARRHKLKRKS